MTSTHSQLLDNNVDLLLFSWCNEELQVGNPNYSLDFIGPDSEVCMGHSRIVRVRL